MLVLARHGDVYTSSSALILAYSPRYPSGLCRGKEYIQRNTITVSLLQLQLPNCGDGSQFDLNIIFMVKSGP